MPQDEWAVVWLAVGAISLAVMALLQVGAVITLLKVVTEALKTIRGVQAQVAPLIDRGQALVANASGVVDQAKGVFSQASGVVSQAQGIVSTVGTQVKRAEGVVNVASSGVTDVTRRAQGMLSGARAFLSVMRGRTRGGDDPAWENG